MEIDVRDRDQTVDKVRFADGGFIRIVDRSGTFVFEDDSNQQSYEFYDVEIDNIILALQKLGGLL